MMKNLMNTTKKDEDIDHREEHKKRLRNELGGGTFSKIQKI